MLPHGRMNTNHVVRPLNMAETEISVLSRQCPGGWLDCQAKVVGQVGPWETERNARQVRTHWTFILAIARQKLRKVYPSIEG